MPIDLTPEQFQSLVEAGWTPPAQHEPAPAPLDLPEGWPKDLGTLRLRERGSGKYIEATVERLTGFALFNSIRVTADVAEPEWTGETDIDWSSQSSERDPASKAIYYWNGDSELTFDDCEIVDQQGNNIGTRLTLNQLIWLRDQLR